jgi:bidirectional [NiFe] hydrogenase diaphorase subunit
MSSPVRVITFTIDGQAVSAQEGQTILEIARENRISIPTLCHLNGLSPVGACRMCLVEIKGFTKIVPACVTRAGEGMEVTTQSEKLREHRRTLVELLFSERNHVCAVCVSNGRCELQTMAQEIGVTGIRVPYRYPRLAVDASHERFTADHNRCVLCARCVRVCDEVEGAHTWDVQGRGIDCLVITDLRQPWGASQTCTGCGKCVDVCPTGALSLKGRAVGEMTKRTQFLPYLKTMRESWYE